jgi:hypothetical protein
MLMSNNDSLKVYLLYLWYAYDKKFNTSTFPYCTGDRPHVDTSNICILWFVSICRMFYLLLMVMMIYLVNRLHSKLFFGFRFIVFNTTFNNIVAVYFTFSVITVYHLTSLWIVLNRFKWGLLDDICVFIFSQLDLSIVQTISIVPRSRINLVSV